MHWKKITGFCLALLTSGVLRAQINADVLNYIQTYHDLAITEMQRGGVPASIILAQGIHETLAGTSDLVRASNNHFGIKCKDTWTGQVVYHDDDARAECFRSYPTAADSYRDHSDFLRNSPRYAALFKLDPKDYEGWAYGLRKAGYATNIRYSQILIKLIKDYHLDQYTQEALEKPMTDSVKTAIAVIEPKPTPATQYPEGTFTINETKAVFVREGTSLLSICEQYDIALGRLIEFNELDDKNILTRDQLIFLQRKRKTGVNAVHVVQQGETIYSICQQEAVRYESVLELNHLQKGEEPAAGEKVYLQSPAASRPLLLKDQPVSAGNPSIPSSF